jgi:hypothetical protein
MKKKTHYRKYHGKHVRDLKKEERELRGIQKVCRDCARYCKVLNAPNSTFICYLRRPKTAQQTKQDEAAA